MPQPVVRIASNFLELRSSGTLTPYPLTHCPRLNPCSTVGRNSNCESRSGTRRSGQNQSAWKWV